MSRLLDSFVNLASPVLGPIGALIAVFILIGVPLAIGLGLLIAAAWVGFTRAFRAATGRAFVFTRQMAGILSSVWGVTLSVGFAIEFYHALVRGVVTTHPLRGMSHTYSLHGDRSGFVLGVFSDAFTAISSWATIAFFLFKGADVSSKSAAAPTPPVQTAPPHKPPSAPPRRS